MTTKLFHHILFSITCILVLISGCTIEPTKDTGSNTEFVKLFGGYSLDIGYKIITCSDGGYAIAGTIQTSAYQTQAVLIRTDKYGNNLPWSPLFLTDTASTYGYNLMITSDGSFLVTGSLLNTTTGMDNYDVMVSKVSSSGQILWMHTYGGTKNDEGKCAIELADGTYAIGGYTDSYSDYGNKEMYLLKLTNTGSLIYASSYGSVSSDKDDFCQDIQTWGGSLILIGSTNSYGPLQNVAIAKIESNNGGIEDFAWYGSNYEFTGIRSVMVGQSNLVILSNYTDNALTSGLYMISLDTANLHASVKENYINNSSSQVSGNDIFMHGNQFVIVGTTLIPEAHDTVSNFLIDVLNTDFTVVNANQQVISSAHQQGEAGCISTDGSLILTGTNKVGQDSKIPLIKMNFPN